MASVASGRRSAGRGPLQAEDNRAGIVFILPAFLVFGVFLFGPVIYAFWLSLHDWEVVRPEKPFIGLANYRQMIDSPDFWNALQNTLWYSAGVVPAQTALGLFLAVLANRKIRGKTFFRTAFYFPSISSSVVISIIFLWIYSANGLLNFLLRQLGLPTPRPPWLSNPRGIIDMALSPLGVEQLPAFLEGPSVALLSIMMLNIWTTSGTMMVIFLAGLQDVPGDIYEAASLDGASRWKMFKDITVPLIRPVTLFVVTLGMIGTLQVFDQIYVMTSGGPAKETQTVAYLIYEEGFRGFAMGYASALAVVLFAIVLVLYLIQRRLIGRTEL